MEKQELIERLEACNHALEYAAYNYDGSIIEELDPNVVESTGVGTTCLIEVKNNKELINQLRESQNPSNENGALPIQPVIDQLAAFLKWYYENDECPDLLTYEDAAKKFLSR
jgi:hypothetical protein